MKLPWKLSLAIAVASALVASQAAAQTADDVSLKETEVAEENSDGDQIQDVVTLTADPGPVYSTIQIGAGPDHRNALGEPAHSTAYVNDSGTFWVEMNADNNDPMFRDNGNAFSSVTLQYLMRKESETESPYLEMTGGLLRLTDYGGGVSPLDAFVTLRAFVYDPETDYDESARFYGFAQVSGRGGTPAAETFHYDFQGFDIQPDDYVEVETRIPLSNGTESVNVFDALLTLPAQVIPIDISDVCLYCEFYLQIETFGYAHNPGGETAVTSYLRDPLHFGDSSNPELGAPLIHFAGVTVLPWVPMPVPEPAALVLLALGSLLTVHSITRYPAGRWFARASSTPRR